MTSIKTIVTPASWLEEAILGPTDDNIGLLLS